MIEDKASGQQLIQMLRSTTQIPVIPFDPTPHGDKVIRAHTVSPLVEAGLVYLPEVAPWLIDFESEIFAFPLSTTKDQVDSMSQFLRWAHDHSVSFEAWGSGQRRAGAMAFDSEGSQLDEDEGYGIIRSSNDMGGY